MNSEQVSHAALESVDNMYVNYYYIKKNSYLF
jgi:hypothetical protein